MRAQLLERPRPGNAVPGGATADRQAGVLRIGAIHQDVPLTKAMTAAIDREIADLAQWLHRDLTKGH